MKILTIIILILGFTVVVFVFKIIKAESVEIMANTEMINGKTYTTAEYVELKTAITGKFDAKTLNFDEGEDWKAVVDNEIKKCGSWILTKVNNDLLEQLNSRLKSGKC